MKKNLTISILAIILFSCQSQKPIQAENFNPTSSDVQLMEKVQKDALKYFWDFAEPNSLLARERYHQDGIYPENDAHIVATGGTGFGLATILVGVEKGYIKREDAVKRLHKIMDFLAKSDRFHGAWSHWINGETGKAVPFGGNKLDNGGDLVETAFLTENLICVREFFKNGNENEKFLAKKCDDLWKGIEWNWYTKNGEKTLYWHWSPDHQWQMNVPLKGYNETLITYIMAASSPEYSIDAETYYNCWTNKGKYTTNHKKYGLPLFVKFDRAEEFGGPLFWAHYSYIGLDPRGLSDKYVKNYFELNQNQVLIDYQYCLKNPKKWKGYNKNYWGLTASYSYTPDGSFGYQAHMPGNDFGVISPTAALSSFPYTPKESMDFLKFIYSQPQFIGEAGPFDATSIHYNNWALPRYLAIDQGTIAPMIENYRSGFLWKLFMNAPEIRKGLQKLDFHSTEYGF